MLNTFKKAGVLLLILTLSGLVFVVVSGDELPPQIPPGNAPAPQNPQEAPQQPNPGGIPAPPQPQQSEQPKPSGNIEKPPQPPEPPQNAPQPGAKPPTPPSEKNIARDEIWHAYQEFQEVNKILSDSKPTEEVTDLENLARQFYEKSEKLYEHGKYRESRVYAHLAIETLHGMRDLLSRR